MDARAYLAECSALLEPAIDAWLPPAASPPEDLHAAMRHLLLPGGKRLRPGFAFAACEAFGSPRERALPIALAVELIHGYSLAHDDLPCMDDDVERRGRPTTHVAWGEAMAVLAGDALQALAFQAVADAAHSVGPGVAVATVAELARAAGPDQLVGGQALDLHFTAGGADEAALVEAVHRRKSAALIAAAVTGGARFGGADAAWVERLHGFAMDVGAAFQIADDLLDAGDEEEPCSLVRVLGPEKARARAEQLLEGALRTVDALGEPGAALRELARAAVRRNR